jgi:hypothetical protein
VRGCGEAARLAWIVQLNFILKSRETMSQRRPSENNFEYRERVLRSLEELPNVGSSIAIDLWDLGIREPDDLIGKDPERMYVDLCEQRGAHIDRCMLYVLRAVVYIASTDKVDPDKKMWWKWKDPVPAKRKRARS